MKKQTFKIGDIVQLIDTRSFDMRRANRLRGQEGIVTCCEYNVMAIQYMVRIKWFNQALNKTDGQIYYGFRFVKTHHNICGKQLVLGFTK